MELRCFNKEKKKVISLQEPIGLDGEGNELYLDDVASSDLDTEEEALKNVDSRPVISRSGMKKAGLGERDIKVLYFRFGLITGTAHTQREVADRLGVSRSYVSRIEKRSLRKLQKKYQALAK
jgi:RNA polymerase sporulation-specific sigma factor